jgi:nitrate/nitrite transport system ATP-binding protein
LDPCSNSVPSAQLATNGPGAVLAEIVENPLPRERARGDVHKHPLYYAVRNHIIDFLVSRSRSFIAEAGDTFDPRHVPLVRPGLPVAVVATGQHAMSSSSAQADDPVIPVRNANHGSAMR